MKHLNKLLFAAMTLMTISSQAQDSNNPWALSFGVNAVDTRASAGGGKNWLDRHVSQPFNISENWNILPSVSYLGLARSVGNNFDFSAPVFSCSISFSILSFFSFSILKFLFTPSLSFFST